MMDVVEIAETLGALLEESETLERELAALHQVAEGLRRAVRGSAARHVAGEAPEVAALLRCAGAVAELLRRVRVTEEAISSALAALPLVLAVAPPTAMSARATEALARRLGHAR